MSAEAKGIAQCGPDGSVLGLVESKVEFWIQLWIFRLMIDRGRDYVMDHGIDAGDTFDHSGRPKQVPGH